MFATEPVLMGMEQPTYWTMLMGLIHAINWSDDVIVYVATLHTVVFVLGLLSINHFNLSMMYLLAICMSRAPLKPLSSRSWCCC